MPPEVMALDIETDCAADAGSMVDGRQRHVVRALNIKCGPCVGSLWRSASQMPQETIRVARAVTAEEEDPRGGDAGLNRLRYRYRLLSHVLALLGGLRVRRLTHSGAAAAPPAGSPSVDI